MSKYISTLVIGLMMCVGLWSCSDPEYESMPDGVQNFVTQYWPNTDVESCKYYSATAEWVVILKNGPTISFDNAQSWISVNGNGLPLSSTLLYDRLPPKLYDYLESGEYVNQVFSISRDNIRYTVQLLDSKLYYVIATQEVTGKE